MPPLLPVKWISCSACSPAWTARPTARSPAWPSAGAKARPGVFAAGDIALYPNKQKLILSGFHEVAMALRRAYRYANPDTALVHTHSSNDAGLQTKLHVTAD